jgi:Rrf2 family transcriptional regulator, cysteine metabolism repressor
LVLFSWRPICVYLRSSAVALSFRVHSRFNLPFVVCHLLLPGQMRISRKAEYALRALLLLARDNPEKVHQIQELSEAGRIPVKFLEQILLTLRNHGILSSKRGVGGGYTLKRRPSDMTVLEIVELMDGPIAPLPCALDKSTEVCSCADPAFCSLRPLMRVAREQLCELFRSRTLQDLADEARDRNVMAFDI